ncbi:hypothetical protein J7L48_04195 [bacterium]|nr:hypothetical protein [bacterium]
MKKILFFLMMILFLLSKPLSLPMRRNPYFAGALSWYYPGLGQLYNGKTLKGALLFSSELALLYIGTNLVSDVSFKLEESIVVNPKNNISRGDRNLSIGLFSILACLHIYNIVDASSDSIKHNLDNDILLIEPTIPPIFLSLSSFIMPGTGQVYNGDIKKGSELIFYNLLLKGWKVYIDYDFKNRKGEGYSTINWNNLNDNDRITFISYALINYIFRFYSAYDAYTGGKKNLQLTMTSDNNNNKLFLVGIKF